MPRFYRYCFFFAPSPPDSFLNECAAATEPPRPLRMAKRFPFVGYKFCSPLIITLFFLRSPSAIVWRVIAIVINAVYRVGSRRSAPHVSEKSSIVVTPLPAHTNPPPPVVLVAGVCRTRCSPLNPLPRLILRRFVAFAVRSIPNGGCFRREASAGFSNTASKITTSYSSCPAAGTIAYPLKSVFTVSRCGLCSEAAKNLVAQINKFTHNTLSGIAQKDAWQAGLSTNGSVCIT